MSRNNQSVYIETYGCSANQNNSEILAGILSRAGFMITNNIELAEIIILNTCIVKSKTESKIKRRIQDISKQNPKKLLIITGCMPETDAKKIKELDDKTIFLGTHHFKDILNLIKDYQDNQLGWTKQEDYLSQKDEIKLNLPKKPHNKLISIHQISEGCLGNCTYCKTRLAKGKLFSYPKEDVLKSIESDLNNGAKEVWITSQDNAAYGMDKGKQDLSALLREIFKLKHRFKLRLGMMDPNNVLPMLDELVVIYRTNSKIFKFLHIPIQSASNKILKDMNRFYTIEQAEHIIKRFRKEIPDITIATDIIVGYPTETKEYHEENIEFIRKFAPDVLNISKFSSHKQTPAGKLKELSASIVGKRTTELMEEHLATAKENKKKFKGREVKVLVEEKLPESENLFRCHDENYNIVIVKGNKELLGKEIEAKIINISSHTMIGEITGKEQNGK